MSSVVLYVSIHELLRRRVPWTSHDLDSGFDLFLTNVDDVFTRDFLSMFQDIPTL